MIVTTYIAIVIAAILGAMGDIMAHNHGASIFKRRDTFSFWGANSWVRKYKYNNPRNGRAFFGSTTFLIWITDGWHLVKTLRLLMIFFAICFGDTLYPLGSAWYLTILEFLIISVIYGGVFEIFYKFILRR